MKRKVLVMVALGLIMTFCLIFDTNITGEFMNKSRQFFREHCLFSQNFLVTFNLTNKTIYYMIIV